MIFLEDPRLCAQKIIDLAGPKIVLVSPLGLGKPVQLLNALYEKVKDDPKLELCILTALTLCRPKIKNAFANELLKPFFDRVYENYEDLQYELDRRAQKLASNVRVIEFYLAAGEYLKNGIAQRNFIYTNYTFAIRDIKPFGVNVIAASVAKDGYATEKFSLSCNADLTKDILNAYPQAFLIGQVNNNLPYMFGEQVEVDITRFSAILESKECNKKLFSIPKMPINAQDYSIGLYASSLIPDDGCLQIGIGNLSDAFIYCLILRHLNNEAYLKTLKKLNSEYCSSSPFRIGLSALTELLVDGYLELYKAGILSRELNSEDPGCIAHAGFFIGSNRFYEELRQMPPHERKKFSMRSISEINQLYGDEFKRRKERKNARFVNMCMKATIFGEIISDTLDNGLTVSGVGGQYNFVAMANELKDANSILLCKSYYNKNGRISSNIIFNGGSSTISRHLRDILITEYGIAYLRGKTDEDVIKSILNITDSRFQQQLLKQAKSAKKICQNYEIPEQFSNNFPEKIEKFFKQRDIHELFPVFPFGQEFEQNELNALKALQRIEKSSLWQIVKMLFKSFGHSNELSSEKMNVSRGFKSAIFRRVLLGSMKENLADDPFDL